MKYQRILHIDDDDDDQEIFSEAVKTVLQSGSCEAVNSASEALRRLTTKEVVPDVIFLDLNMPVMNGKQFLIEIKRNRDLQDIPVVILSTTSNPGTMRMMKELGAVEFISKPGSFTQLVELLKPVLL
jgi:CheY-like chemotaxis protein